MLVHVGLCYEHDCGNAQCPLDDCMLRQSGFLVCCGIVPRDCEVEEWFSRCLPLCTFILLTAKSTVTGNQRCIPAKQELAYFSLGIIMMS